MTRSKTKEPPTSVHSESLYRGMHHRRVQEQRGHGQFTTPPCENVEEVYFKLASLNSAFQLRYLH